MKIYKIFAIALAALTFSACSDDDDVAGLNSASGVTVEMKSATFNIDENIDVFKVPVAVTGKANGKIEVTVAVSPGPANPDSQTDPTEPAKVVENYNVTSYTIYIPEGETEGYIECTNVWEQGEINDDRVFTMTIKDVKGATLGAQKDCVVTLVNIDDPYTSMCGTWKLKAVNMSSGEPVEYNITMSTVTPGDSDYGKVLYGFGFAGESDYLIPFTNFNWDVDTNTGTMEIGYGYMMTDGLAFNYGLEAPAFPVCMWREGRNVTVNKTIVCSFDGNYNNIAIPQEANIFAGLYYTTTMQFCGYSVGWIGEIQLSR